MIRKREGIVSTQDHFFQILTVGHFCHFYFDLGHRSFWNYPRTILRQLGIYLNFRTICRTCLILGDFLKADFGLSRVIVPS